MSPGEFSKYASVPLNPPIATNESTEGSHFFKAKLFVSHLILKKRRKILIV